MILRRLAQAIRGQHWTTLALELLILVIGIFLGLQVDDWNESRKHQQQESVYMHKIYQDLTAMRAELEEIIQRGEKFIGRMTAALHALEACDASYEAQSNIKFALESYQVLPGINYLDATYNEMVASGSLVRIKNHELKQKIAYAYSALERFNLSLLSYRISMPNVDLIVWRNVSYSIEKDSGKPTVSFEMTELCENIEVRNAFVEMIDIQSDGKGTAGGALTSVHELMAILSEEIGKSID